MNDSYSVNQTQISIAGYSDRNRTEILSPGQNSDEIRL